MPSVTDPFEPPRRILMGPGPSDVHPRVLAAMAKPTLGHLDPEFVGLMEVVKHQLQFVMRTDNELTFPISAPGSAGMEACLVNLIEPGDAVVVCRNGVFGGRMHSIIERAGGRAIAVDDAWGEPVDPAKVEAALAANPDAKLLAFVHAETSTGALSDAKTLAAIGRAHGCLVVVDAVTSLAGVPLEVDAWGLDAVYAGSQKCISCAPGLSPVSFSPRAIERVRARTTPVQSWFFDLGLVMGYWSGGAKRAYHHTAPVNAIYGLHEALRMVCEEGLEAAWARHRHHHTALVAGLEALGLRLRVAPEHRLPQLNAVELPADFQAGEAAARKRLLDDYGLELGGGLGDLAGKVWRIGLMGAACTRANVLLCLAAIDDVMTGVAPGAGQGHGVAAALKVYAC